MESYQRVLKFLGCSESTVTNRSSSCWTTNMFSSASIARAIVYGIVDAVGEACCGSVLDRFIHVLDDRVEAASNPSE